MNETRQDYQLKFRERLEWHPIAVGVLEEAWSGFPESCGVSLAISQGRWPVPCDFRFFEYSFDVQLFPELPVLSVSFSVAVKSPLPIEVCDGVGDSRLRSSPCTTQQNGN